jgi:hypothetical protein
LPQDRATRPLFSIKQERESQDSYSMPFPTMSTFRKIRGSAN